MNRIAILGLAAVVALAACQPKGGSGGAASSDKSKTLATVNGTPITQNFFDGYIRAVTGKGSSELSAEQRATALDNLIRARVIADAAAKDGSEQDPQTQALIELSRLNVLQQVESEKFLKDKPATDQELHTEYESQVSSLPQQEYHARHILVATESFAQKVVNELEKGQSFEDVARRESMDQSKTNGGDLGWFTTDRMVKPFADAVVALKPGQYTHTPVQTQYGWHIIRLEDVRPVAAPPFDQVRQRLDQVVESKKFNDYVTGLVKAAKVEKMPDATPAAPASDSSGGASGAGAAAPAAGSAPAAPAATPPAAGGSGSAKPATPPKP